MKNKIVFKSILSRFFFMNLTIFIILVCIQLIAQNVLFEKYYINNKERTVEEETKKFTQFLYNLNGDNESSKYRDIMDYMLSVNSDKKVDLSIIHKGMNNTIGIESYMQKNYLTLEDNKSKEEYKIVVGDFLSGMELKVDDIIKVEGLKDEYGYIIPQSISINNKEIYIHGMDIALITPFNVNDSDKYTKINKIKSTSILGQISNPTLNKRDLVLFKNTIEGMPYFVKNNIENKNTYTTVQKLEEQNNDYIISSQKLGDYYIVGINQLSEVNDFIEGTDKFYLIIFILALPIIGIISLIYSKFMAKPLIEMSDIANEISNFNFELKYRVCSQDEIGRLGNALNNIGSNLEKNLNDLNEKIYMQKVQEQNRKELIDNISHELKTPLTIIQGNIQGYMKGVYSKEVFEDILYETDRMNSLLVQMLDMSNIEQPTFVLPQEIFDFNYTILRELDKLRFIFEENGLNLKLYIEDELQGEDLIVLGDEQRIAESLRNLLTNAIKYTPYGYDVVIKVSQNKDYYYFSIENFGTTVSSEELENIWEPFYCSEKSRNKKYGGTGLGLYFVKKILEAHNYEYGVYSYENSVKFCISIKKYIIDEKD